MTVKPLMRAENLRLNIAGREIFRVGNLTLERGEVMALVGPNGAGKTSLLLTLALLRMPTQGSIGSLKGMVTDIASCARRPFKSIDNPAS